MLVTYRRDAMGLTFSERHCIMITFKTLGADAQVRKLVHILEMDQDRSWQSRDIHDEYKRRHPDDPKKENRGAAIRNQLQRYCLTSKQYQEGYPPLFENPSKALWRLAPEYQIYLLAVHVPSPETTENPATYAA
jgi:hypothetical protein